MAGDADRPQPACINCGEIVTEEDRPRHVRVDPAVHTECFIRMAAGGVFHQLGECTCCGGRLDPDPQGLSRRQCARLAKAVFDVLQNA